MNGILDTPVQRLSRVISSVRLMQKPLPLPGTQLDMARRQFMVGIVLLMVVVLLWTSSNFVTQALFQDGYEKPFFVTYMNTSAFSLYLVPFLWRRWRDHFKRGADLLSSEDMANGGYQQLATHPGPEYEGPDESPSSNNASPPLTIRETADLALLFCFLWFIANWTVNASLNYTSVASATILSSMSGFFTLGIGRLFLVEVLTIAKVAAVLTSFLGVLIVSVSDSNYLGTPNPQPVMGGPSGHISHPFLGDTLALLSAIFYALYVILLKVRIRTESRVDMQLFFGFVGLFNVVLCWPIGLVLHFTGVESFELPTTIKVVAAILVNMFITLSSDYLYILAMLKTTPLVVTLGLSLTIPLAVIGDFLLGKPTKGQVLVGAALVLISFVVVGLDDAAVNAG